MESYLLLNDQPISDERDDLLRTSETASRITSLLTLSRNASPFVVALDARWGMGKSTLLRQIESQLTAQPEVETARFNAWTAQGENALEGLIKSVLSELDPNTVRRWARRISKQRRVISPARIGFGLAARFVGVTRLVDELWNQLAIDARSRNELRDVIQGMLGDWMGSTRFHGMRRALIVFIDDLDRCSDEAVIKVCEAVKLYLDAPGLIFVIACDLSVIARSVSAPAQGGMSEGRAYLEKIAQVVHRLPRPDEKQLHNLIQGYAQQSATEQLIDPTVTKILIDRTDGNPRRIKRIINSVVLESRLNPAWEIAPLSSTQLVTAILLQLLYTPFYDFLVSEESGEDPIEEFLQYVKVRERSSNPPASDQAWWSLINELFQKNGLPQPERTSKTRDLTTELEKLERNLPEEFPVLARKDSFVALLRDVGDAETRRALRTQLIRRPLGSRASIEEDTTAPLLSGTFAGWHIVCIDDNPPSIDDLVYNLKNLGASVSVYSDGESADTDILSQPPDAIVSDIQRGTNPVAGFEHIAHLRSQGHLEPVVFFTGRITPERRKRAAELNAGISTTEDAVLRILRPTWSYSCKIPNCSYSVLMASAPTSPVVCPSHNAICRLD
jgi:CheY-like chemotaxis protein